MKNTYIANVWLKSPDHKSYLEITFVVIETFIRNSLNMFINTVHGTTILIRFVSNRCNGFVAIIKLSNT